MINKRKLIWLVVGILSGFALILSVVLLMNHSGKPEDTWKELAPLIREGWVIIDGVIEDQKAYMIISTSKNKAYGDLFVVFRLNSSHQWEQEYTNDFGGLQPWKLELGDVNGDGTAEILIAVCKTTHFDHDEKNRMFVFNYDGEKLIKTWTGTGTAESWDNFLIGDLLPVKGEELIFIEEAEDGKEKLSVYYWFDFGFVLLAESESFKNILNISITGENRLQITYDRLWKKEAILTVKDNVIIKE